MLTASEVLDASYLDLRCMLLEIAATLDRLDAAGRAAGASGALVDTRLGKIYQSLTLLAERTPREDRAETLLGLFSDPAPTL